MQTPLIAWNVPASEYGLEQCRIDLPPTLLEHDVFVSPVCMGSKLLPDYRKKPALFHTIIKPAGTLIDIHDDGPLTANALIQIVGHTVLLTWHGTDSNRRFFEPFHCTQHPFILSRALDSMTGLKVTILNPGVGVIMDAGMIYGEMSRDTSATGGWVFVKAEWLLRNNEIQNGCSREVHLIKTRMAQPLGMDDDVCSMIHVMEYGMNMWKCLLENMKDEMTWNDAFESIREIEDLIRHLDPKLMVKRKRGGNKKY
jgi:hypothetical protein